MKKFIEGKSYNLESDTGSFVVVCNQVFANGSASLYRYKKEGAKTPIARYRANKAGIVLGHEEIRVTLAKKVKSTKTPLENSAIMPVIMKGWKNDNPSGYYRGMANMNVKDELSEDLMFLANVRKILEVG